MITVSVSVFDVYTEGHAAPFFRWPRCVFCLYRFKFFALLFIKAFKRVTLVRCIGRFLEKSRNDLELKGQVL